MFTLPLSNVVSVNVFFPPTGIGSFNVNNLALFTSDPFLSNTAGDIYRVYTSAQQVGVDFGTTTETYQQAVSVFSQQPNILAGNGSLLIFPSFTANAVNTVTVSAGGTGYVVGDVLNIVQGSAYGGTVTVATVYAGAITAVTVTTGGAGYSAASGLATTGGTGSGATITISTLTTETLAQAIARVASLVYFCGIISTAYGANTTWAALATTVQSYGNKLLFLPSKAVGDITGVFTTIKNASNYYTRTLFFSDATPLNGRLFAAAYASKLLSVNFEGSQTAITMNLKQLTGVTPDAGVTQTIATLAAAAGVDLYASYAGNPAVISNGANKYADQSFNLIWFILALQVAGYNALASINTKLPQTESGMNLYKSVLKHVCERGLTNGYLSPGKWTGVDTFGVQEDFLNNILTKGYYIYSPPITDQLVADRAARKAPLVQIAVKETGAIHSSVINVYVNP